MISPGRRAIVAVFYGPARKSQQTGSSFLCCHGEVVYVVASSERFFFQHPSQRSYRRENRCRDICEWEYQSHLNKDYTCVCILHGETRTTYVMSWLPWHVFSRLHYYPNSLPFFNWLTVTHHPYVSCHLTHLTPNYIVFTLSILSIGRFLLLHSVSPSCSSPYHQ